MNERNKNNGGKNETKKKRLILLFQCSKRTILSSSTVSVMGAIEVDLLHVCREKKYKKNKINFKRPVILVPSMVDTDWEMKSKCR